MSIVLITGAGSGIGAATARAFAARGDVVHVVDVDLAAAEQVAAEIGGKAHEVDVRDRAAMDALAAEVGRVDVLVNNAGVGMTGRLTDMTEADWTWIRSVNLDGVVNGCAAFGPAMLAAGRGHVVNLSSGLGYTPTATEPAYVTTKAGVLALSRCLRADWATHGVGVSAICPGVINTPIIDRTRFVGEQDDPSVRRRTTRLFRRGHKPEAVAAAIVKAVERNRPVVPVGFEAWLGWWLHRYLPVRAQDALGRLRP
jgi:NAD(P)-dependent dehydrogenase (short-subunit alcohol dehydrogenase family)